MGKKILYIYGGLYTPNGMSTMISQKVNYLADNTNNDIYIVLTEHPEIPRVYQLSERVHVKILEINFDDLDTMPLGKKVFCYWKKQRKFKKLLTNYMVELSPDITVSITRREINFLNQINDGSKKIAEIHFSRMFYRQFNKRFLPDFMNRYISKIWMNSLIKNLRLLDKFVVLTEEDSHNWPELTNVVVIPNFVSSLSDKKTLCKNRRIVAAGRYSHQKGFDLLINVWEKVTKIHPDWSLDIYGPGNNEAYQILANEKGLTSSLHCNPAVPNIFEKYAESSIFVLSSRYEGFGLVIVEAMGVGLPVVSFACPCGPRDLIEDGVNGYLVENGDIDGMARRICQLIENEESRICMGKNAIATAEKYDKDIIMQRWINLFDSL